MRRAIVFFAALLCLATGAAAAKTTQFWNLTSSTVKSIRLAPASTPAFGPNQCLNDPDGAVDHDERLKVTGVTSGSYDARLTLAHGRRCLARNIQVELGKPFSIEDKDLMDCTE